jgi:neutral ceramidase
MTLVKFTGASGDRGFLSFFPVHGTSIYENNTLISGDNKGMAAYLYESEFVPVIELLEC